MDHWEVVPVRGVLDLSTAAEVSQRLLARANATGPRLALDLSGLLFMDTTGVGMLVRFLHVLRSRDGDLALIAPNGQVLRVLKLMNLLSLFHVYDSVSATHERIES